MDPTKCYLATRIAKRFNPIDRFLMHQLKSKYIHSEIVFPDTYLNISFSSRGRVRNTQSKIKGVQLDYVDYSKGLWRFDDLKLNALEIEFLYRDCKSWVGAEYDTWGAILKAGQGLNIEDGSKFYCSEICAAVLMELFNIQDFHINPKDLLFSVLDHTSY